ncbi:MAG TPA: hypothetical protein VFY82_08270 [Acidimicrobiales bacterium]|nr:hypothetical protein [Acidimicrobiales bacterium]
MSTAMSASPEDRMIRVPRSPRSRLLGSTAIPFPLPCGVLFVLIVVNGLFGDTSGVRPEDRLSPSGLVLTAATLTLMAVGGLVLGTVEWRRSVTLDDDGVAVHTGWRRRCVAWEDVEAIEFRQIPMGRGTTPAAELVRRDGSRVELRALAQTGRRVRQRQVDVLAGACTRHGVEVRSDGSWWWRRIDLAGQPGGLRVAHGKPESGS